MNTLTRIVLTFKDNEKEKKIEEFLTSKLSSTMYIKELVWDVMNNNQIKTTNKDKEEPPSEEVVKPKAKVGGFRK